jgi:SAM-dependent methyltransferase
MTAVESPTLCRCPACGAEDEFPRVTVPDREYGLELRVQYAACAACASVFQVPMPGLGDLGSFYPADYHSMSGNSPLAKIRHGMRVRRLLRLVPSGAAILDYGSGNGSFLLAAAAAAPEGSYYGYEIGGADSVRELEGGKVKIFEGSAEHLLAYLPEVHLITMNHVIEHLPGPLGLLESLLGKLKPGGVFEGQTPAAGSLEHRVFGRHWSGYHAPRHTVVFSRQGLSKMLQQAGLEAITIQGAFNPAGLAVSFASLRQGDAGGTIRRGGFGWLFHLGLGALFAPFDLFLGWPGIVNFKARKPESPKPAGSAS